MLNKVKPSAHVLEMFMPLRSDEKRMLDIMRKVADFGFYQNFELPVFFSKKSRTEARNILEKYNLKGMTFLMPYVKDQKMCISSFDQAERIRSIDFCKELIRYASEAGYSTVVIPSGADPGYHFRGIAKNLLTESYYELYEEAEKYSLNLNIEPLDRYAYKKQLIGPIEETVTWFEEIHEACPKTYIHWDSAHEALGKIDLMHSLDVASKYIGQAHLCNAILDEGHPCYGDLHMDIGTAPDFITEGFLTPGVASSILKKLASFEAPAGIESLFVSVEVLGHPGDDLWLRERNVREFLQYCFKLADIQTE